MDELLSYVLLQLSFFVHVTLGVVLEHVLPQHWPLLILVWALCFFLNDRMVSGYASSFYLSVALTGEDQLLLT